jgi:hypothetical protein
MVLSVIFLSLAYSAGSITPGTHTHSILAESTSVTRSGLSG